MMPGMSNVARRNLITGSGSSTVTASGTFVVPEYRTLTVTTHGPQGAQGATGAQGSTGAQGPGDAYCSGGPGGAGGAGGPGGTGGTGGYSTKTWSPRDAGAPQPGQVITVTCSSSVAQFSSSTAITSNVGGTGGTGGTGGPGGEGGSSSANFNGEGEFLGCSFGGTGSTGTTGSTGSTGAGGTATGGTTNTTGGSSYSTARIDISWT